MDLSKTWVILPAYNEETTIGQVIKDLQGKGLTNLVVIDDGSTDRTAEIAQSKNAIVISLPINCGVGTALSTGFEFLKQNKLQEVEAVITFDADGQHLAGDALKVVEPILKKAADFVIGSRLTKAKHQMPLLRRLGNWSLNLLIYLFFGVKTTDSQSGLRALSTKALQKIQVRSTGYEASSEFFREISQHQLNYLEVPINSIYTQYSLAKGQNFSRALYTIRSFLLGNIES